MKNEISDNEILVEDVKTPFGHVTVCGPRWQLHGGTDHNGKHYNQGWKQVIGRLLYEPFATDTIDKLDFDIFFDIGAAFGYYSHYVKGKRNKVVVHAVECDHLRFGCLLRTSNGTFHCHHVAIGKERPELVEPGRLVSSHINGKRPLLYCPLTTLSSLFYDLADDEDKVLIKLDVEGVEFEQIPAALQQVANPNISWIIEAHRWKDEPGKLIDLFVEAKHNIHILDFDINRTTLTFCATHQVI